MLYIQNRAGETLAVIGKYYKDTRRSILENGASTYQFTISKNEADEEFVIRGNYIIMLDSQGRGHQYTIIRTEENHDEKEVYCEDASLELLNKERRAWAKPATAQPISYYANKALADTGWEIGLNEIPSLKRTLEWTGRDTAFKRLLSIANAFDVELDFYVDFNMTNVVRRVVDIKKMVGSIRDDIQLVYGESVTDIKKTESIESMVTALEGIGSVVDGTPEGQPEEHYNFSEIAYDDGDYFSPKGDPLVYARTANQEFNIRKGYIERGFEYDTKDPQELLNRAISELKKVSQPMVNYEVSLVKYGITNLHKGDTVKIIDSKFSKKAQLLLQTRVLEISETETGTGDSKATFGNFFTLQSNLSKEIMSLQQQLRQLPKARTPYPWVRYADDDKGIGMSMFPAGKAYMATVWNYETAVPSDNPIDYAGKWVKVKGKDGQDGTPGKPGADGKTPYFHTAWADSADGTDGFYVGGGTNLLINTSSSATNGRTTMQGANSVVNGVYSRTDSYEQVSTPDSYNELFYRFMKPKTNDLYGLTPGETYTLSGSTSHTSGEMKFRAEYSTGSNWINLDNISLGIPVSDGSVFTPFSYTFTVPVGATGIFFSLQNYDYTDGSLFRFKDMKFEKGSIATPWSPAPEEAHPIYMGTYTDFMQADSLDPSAYTWSLIKGADGKDGEDGEDGLAGKDGVGIKTTTIAYQSGTSGTVQPTGTWVANPPSVPGGQYLWTRTTWQYTDGTTEAGYSVGKIGQTGKKGDPGSKDVPVTTVSAAQPTTAKNGDIWWVLNSTDVATAMKVYTSGAWVDKKVDQSVLNIVTLNAVEINGSTINGSEVNTSYTGVLANGHQGSSQQILDNTGYSQTSTFPRWDGSQIVTRSEIDNIGRFVTGYTPQAKYNPSQPWDNTEGSIYINPLSLDIGFTGADLSGDYYLSVQDAYQNSGSATYLNGWGSWNADYSLKVVRQGRMVTVWGYIKHNNSATITPFAQVPAWARPEQGILISAVTFNSKVGNPIASALVMNADTGKIGFNSGGQKGGYVCFSTTYVGGDV